MVRGAEHPYAAATMAAPPGKRRLTRTVIAASWVRAAREEASLTQEELARRLDVSVSTVAHREGGRRTKVYVETWLAILCACGLPSTWQPPSSAA